MNIDPQPTPLTPSHTEGASLAHVWGPRHPGHGSVCVCPWPAVFLPWDDVVIVAEGLVQGHREH